MTDTEQAPSVTPWCCYIPDGGLAADACRKPARYHLVEGYDSDTYACVDHLVALFIADATRVIVDIEQVEPTGTVVSLESIEEYLTKYNQAGDARALRRAYERGQIR